MKRSFVALVLVLAAAATASVARAGSNFFFGFSDDGPKWGGAAAAEPARAAGASAMRITLRWSPGESDLTSQDIADVASAVAGTSGLRLVLAAFGSPTSAPQDAASRTEFCTYARNAVARFPSINDVVIWNEPNVSAFWRPQFNPDDSSAAPAGYEALLARCWEVLHAFRAGIDVIGPATSPRGNDNPHAASNISHSPVTFIKEMGLAYVASGRTQPLFDTVGQHVYQNTFAERPFLIHTVGRTICRRPSRTPGSPSRDRTAPWRAHRSGTWRAVSRRRFRLIRQPPTPGPRTSFRFRTSPAANPPTRARRRSRPARRLTRRRSFATRSGWRTASPTSARSSTSSYATRQRCKGGSPASSGPTGRRRDRSHPSCRLSATRTPARSRARRRLPRPGSPPSSAEIRRRSP